MRNAAEAPHQHLDEQPCERQDVAACAAATAGPQNMAYAGRRSAMGGAAAISSSARRAPATWIASTIARSCGTPSSRTGRSGSRTVRARCAQERDHERNREDRRRQELGAARPRPPPRRSGHDDGAADTDVAIEQPMTPAPREAGQHEPGTAPATGRAATADPRVARRSASAARRARPQAARPAFRARGAPGGDSQSRRAAPRRRP